MLEFYLSLVETDEDRSKVELIYTRYREHMMYRAFEVLRNKSDAEDAVHEAMLRIINVLHSVDTSDEKILKCFCGRVAENTARDMNRRQKNEHSNLSFDNILFDPHNKGDMPEEVFFGKKAYEVVYNAVQNMNPTYRDVCTMKFLNGFNDMEISVLLNMNYKSVSVYASRGRQIIKDALKEASFNE